MQQNKKTEALTDVDIVEIRELFSLFDKNSDGYVGTNELGAILRSLNFNPTEQQVTDYEKEVDPNDTGSFDQMNLISLIARNPKESDTMENMIEAIKLLATSQGEEAEDQKHVMKIDVDSLEFYMTRQGEQMTKPEFDEIMLDCKDLIVERTIIIEELAKYLMTR